MTEVPIGLVLVIAGLVILLLGAVWLRYSVERDMQSLERHRRHPYAHRWDRHE